MCIRDSPGFDAISGTWSARAPLDWSLTDATPVGNMCAFLLSDLASMTTGEMIHVDGGYHALGADFKPRSE